MAVSTIERIHVKKWLSLAHAEHTPSQFTKRGSTISAGCFVPKKRTKEDKDWTTAEIVPSWVTCLRLEQIFGEIWFQAAAPLVPQSWTHTYSTRTRPPHPQNDFCWEAGGLNCRLDFPALFCVPCQWFVSICICLSLEQFFWEIWFQAAEPLVPQSWTHISSTRTRPPPPQKDFCWEAGGLNCRLDFPALFCVPC